MLETVEKFFSSLVNKYGNSYKSLDWSSKEKQWLRFKMMTGIGDLNNKTILDVGCGLGHLLDYFAERGITPKRYVGIDISPSMIAKAKELHVVDNVEFYVKNIDSVNEKFDYVICSGTLNIKVDTPSPVWREWVLKSIDKMFNIANIGVAFNMIPIDIAEYYEDRVFYADPVSIFAHCRELTRYLQFRSDYPLYEFTMYLYKGVD